MGGRSIFKFLGGVLTALVLGAAVFVAVEKGGLPVSLPAAGGGEEVVLYDDDDREMNAAIDAARGTLDGFLAKLDDPSFRPEMASLKVAIPTPDGGAEHIFLTGINRLGPDSFEGMINNDPVNLPDLALGDRYRFDRDQISDWNYVMDGRIHGSYTLRVMLPRLPADQAEKLDRMLAPLP